MMVIFLNIQPLVNACLDTEEMTAVKHVLRTYGGKVKIRQAFVFIYLLN